MQVNCIEHAFRGAQAATDALVLVHDARTAAEAARGLGAHLLFGEGRDVLLERLRRAVHEHVHERVVAERARISSLRKRLHVNIRVRVVRELQRVCVQVFREIGRRRRLKLLHLLPLALASLAAFATTELWHAKPLYGELLLRLLQNTKTLEANHAEQERNIIELTVDTGSAADGRLVREINWPRHTLLVDVKRGDEELIPEGNTRLHSGDTLYILGYATEIRDLEKLVGKEV